MSLGNKASKGYMMPSSVLADHASSGRKVCAILSPEHWISSVLVDNLGESASFSDHTSPWDIRSATGLVPEPNMLSADALWISPGLLIAHNAWLQRYKLEPLRLPAPIPNWLELLAVKAPRLTGRHIVTATVQELRHWIEFPLQLGKEPWSQLAQGRVSDFPAARRSFERLQKDLASAPDTSLIQMSEHTSSISEEWRVVISQGKPVAVSGYCVHSPLSRRKIFSVFDGAHFDPSHKQQALAIAQEAAHITGLQYATLDLAFLASERKTSIVQNPIVLEANPLWCSAPYLYGRRGSLNFLDAIHLCEQTSYVNTHDGLLTAEGVYRADPWMMREFSRRYVSYPNPHPDYQPQQSSSTGFAGQTES